MESVGREQSVIVYDRGEWWRLGPSYCRAFEAIGWNARLLDTSRRESRLQWWLRSRLGNRLTRRNYGLRRRGSSHWNQEIARSVGEAQPVLCLIMNGMLVMPETVERLQNQGVAVAVLYTDNPFPEGPSHRPEYLPVLRKADVCFIWSRRLEARLEDEGARRVVYLPFAWDAEVIPHVRDAVGNGPEVVFVGGWDQHRERWLEPVAERFELEIWGPDYWGTRTRPGNPLRDCWRGRALRGREAAEAVAGADIALNVLREQNLPDGTNMRTFEVPGAGGFLLSTRTSGATEIYPEGEASAYFGSVQELLEKIEYYLKNATERREIARRAHEITARKHRYVHRARRILKSVELMAL